MKCENCGSEMSIGDKECNFCKFENPYYKEHQESMKKYKERFKETKIDVYEKTGRFTELTIKITVTAVLVALNLIFLLIGVKSWEINDMVHTMSGAIHAKEHKEKLYELERAGDYLGFYGYHTAKDLLWVRKLDEFDELRNCCSSYEMIYKYLLKLTVEEEGYMSRQDCVAYINEALNRLFDSVNPGERYYNEDCYTEEHIQAMQDVQDQAYVLLHVYCNISWEDLENFSDLSLAKRQSLIDEGVGIYDE